MKQIKETRASSFLIGELPVGCKQCIEGKKIVIFITGLCTLPDLCSYYCPISDERKGKNPGYANDRPISSFDDVLIEAKNMDAKGAGITGGDPLIVIEKTIDYISKLKKHFGRDFHIHLYCSSSPYLTIQNIRKLKDAGLDEIRFHVDEDQWHMMLEAKQIGLKVGAEVPAIDLDELKKLGNFLSENKLDFLNLNEFEFSETNAEALKEKGFKLMQDSLIAIEGSEKIAKKFMNWALKHLSLNIHFCTVRLKDGFQFKNRMIRTAKNIHEPHEVVTDEGLILKGIISWNNEEEKLKILSLIDEYFEIPEDFMKVNETEQKVEIQWEILDESNALFKSNGLGCGIVEVLPDYKRTLIRYDPY